MADIGQSQLGSRLRDARENCGLSQQAVADALTLPRTAVTNMEAGTRAISTLELMKLADLYDRPAALFLSNEAPSTEETSVILLRALQRDSNEPGFRAAIDRVLTLCREGAALRALLGQSFDTILPQYAARAGSVGDAIRQGEFVAQEERRRLGLGDAPIGSIASLIAHQGVWVAACEFPPHMDLSGLFAHDQRTGLAIIVNVRHAAARRRFSYAHEYGHALLDRAEPYRLTRGSNGNELIEKRANAFAAAFLMPRGGVEAHLRKLDKGRPSRQLQIVYDVARDAPSEAEIRPPVGSQTITWQDVGMMARYFGVSYESAVWRLANLDHLTPSERAVLLSQKDRRLRLEDILKLQPDDWAGAPEGKKDDGPENLELKNQVVGLAIEAFRREEISQGRLRELASKLGLSGADLIELAEAARD
jgi:Zn-dependent peptidase ImmA (M78 family)/DNA-binding XRE family transcriptional regulator